MKAILSILIIIMVLITNACTVVGTLYPIYDNKKDYIFKKELTGKWMDKEDSTSYIVIDTVAERYGKLYTIYSIYIDGETKREDTSRFFGHLINRDGWFFMEYWFDLNSGLRDFMVVRHFVVRVKVHDNNEVELNFPDADQLIKLIDLKKIQLAYFKEVVNSNHELYSYLILDKSPVLRRALAETKNIQGFI